MSYLSLVFGEHGEQAKNSPQYNSDHFNLPIALKSMADEIVVLREHMLEMREKLVLLRQEFDGLHTYCTQSGWVVK